MSTRKRKQLESIYGQKYSKISAISLSDNGKCLYCGEIMQCFDHQPPISMAEHLSYDHGHIEYALIPACNECNSLLGETMTSSVNNRFNLCKNLLRKKYESMLKSTATDRDLTDIRGSLRRQCIAYDDMADIVRNRIAFQGYAFDLPKGKVEIESTEIEVDGLKFNDKFSALAHLCEVEGISYSKLVNTVDVHYTGIYGAIDEYKRRSWVSTLKKKIKNERNGKWKGLPQKIIDHEIDKVKVSTTYDMAIEKIDKAYVSYRENMGYL